MRSGAKIRAEVAMRFPQPFVFGQTLVPLRPDNLLDEPQRGREDNHQNVVSPCGRKLLSHINFILPEHVVEIADLDSIEIDRRQRIEPVKAQKYRDRKSTRLNSSHGYISYAVL